MLSLDDQFDDRPPIHSLARHYATSAAITVRLHEREGTLEHRVRIDRSKHAELTTPVAWRASTPSQPDASSNARPMALRVRRAACKEWLERRVRRR